MILMILTTFSNGPFWVDSLALIDRMFDSRQKCRIASVNQINSSINATGSPVSACRTRASHTWGWQVLLTGIAQMTLSDQLIIWWLSDQVCNVALRASMTIEALGPAQPWYHHIYPQQKSEMARERHYIFSRCQWYIDKPVKHIKEFY